MKSTSIFLVLVILISSLLVVSPPEAGAQSNTLTFASFGDYGVNNEYEAAVATLVNSWNPDMILALGDAYYLEAGGTGSETYDLSTGKYYCNYLKDINTTGTACPSGQAAVNRFFPALGDHDYTDAATTDNLPTAYTDYFSLPGNGYTSSSGNERYYDFVSGPVHFFVLNSLSQAGYEPDGTSSTSIQAQWLKTQLGASTSTWNVVVSHNPPYSSGIKHGSKVRMQWPFAEWGADVVLSGDEHNYERIVRDGIVYLVNGLGGAWPYAFGTPIEGSAIRYNTTNGALRVTATNQSMTFAFYSIENGGTLIDTYTITEPHKTATPTLPVVSSGWQSPSLQAAQTSTGDNNGYELNPTYAFANDGLAAMDIDSGTSAIADCTDSGKDKHRFYRYNLSIPTEALIGGIQVRLDAHADSTAGSPKLCVALSWNGGSTWSAWKTSPVLTDSEQTYLLGGSSENWGHAWTAAEFSNTNFQVRIADIASTDTRDFSLDWVAVNVAYALGPTTTPSGTPTFTASPTPTPTTTPTTSSTPTVTFSATSTDTASPPATQTPSPTGTNTSTFTATSTFANTPTDTASPTASSSPTGSLTFTPTAAEALTVTATDQGTSLPADAATSTSFYTPTSSATSTATATMTHAFTATATASSTSTTTSTATQTSTPTASRTPTLTVMATKTATTSSGPIFTDVLSNYWALRFIERLYAAGVTGGCMFSPLSYCPEGTVTRAQMAVFLLKGKHGSGYVPPAVGPSTGFNDVATTHWAGAWIKQLAAEGITGGCGNGNYCPEQPVTRVQMAVFLLKAKHGASYTPPGVGVGTGFDDVKSHFWAAAWIKQLVTEGITSGCGNNNYCPEQPVTRAQMAVFLVRTFNLP